MKSGYIELSLKDIRRGINASRSTYDEADLQILEESVKKHGLLQAPGVVPTDSGDYEAVYGNRRLIVLERLGEKRVWVKVASDRTDLSDAEKASLNFEENVVRKQPSIVDAAKTFLKMIDDGMQPHEVAHYCRTTEKKVKDLVSIMKTIDAKHLRALTADEPGKRKAMDGIFTESKLSKVITSRLKYGLDDKQVNELVSACRTPGVDLTGVIFIAKRLKAGASLEAAVAEFKSETSDYKSVHSWYRVKKSTLKKFKAKYPNKHLRNLIVTAFKANATGEERTELFDDVRKLISGR